MTDPLGRSSTDLTRESTDLIQTERQRQQTLGFSLEHDVDHTLDDWEETLSGYFGKARQAVHALDVDGDGDIDINDVEQRIVRFVSVGVGWLDAWRSSHSR